MTTQPKGRDELEVTSPAIPKGKFADPQGRDLCESTKFIFVKQTNELIREKEHVDISDTAKFQSSGPNAGEMADI